MTTTTEMTRESISKHMREMVPDHFAPGLLRWVLDGIKPGSFLTAVISNDLKGAVFLGDQALRCVLPEIVRSLHYHCPLECHGSPEVLKTWKGIPVENKPVDHERMRLVARIEDLETALAATRKLAVKLMDDITENAERENAALRESIREHEGQGKERKP